MEGEAVSTSSSQCHRPRPDALATVTLNPIDAVRVGSLSRRANVRGRRYLSNGESLGRTVASQEQEPCAEESPGSLDKLPGNAWAPLAR
jgi:hypothetical protein